MANVTVNAGICGFTTVVNAESDDSVNAVLRIISECPAYAYMNDNEYEMDAYACCFGKVGQSPIYEFFAETSLHAACPVPSAALKAMEVACSLALPKDVSMTVAR